MFGWVDQRPAWRSHSSMKAVSLDGRRARHFRMRDRHDCETTQRAENDGNHKEGYGSGHRFNPSVSRVRADALTATAGAALQTLRTMSKEECGGQTRSRLGSLQSPELTLPSAAGGRLYAHPRLQSRHDSDRSVRTGRPPIAARGREAGVGSLARIATCGRTDHRQPPPMPPSHRRRSGH